MKKIVFAFPAIAAVSSFAAAPTTNGLTEANVTKATQDLVQFGGYIIGGIGLVIATSAGLRLLVKSVNRAVGK